MSCMNGDQRIGEGRSAPTPLIAITSVILSMTLVAIGNGLLFAYVLLDEPITLFTYVGTGLVLVALFIGQRAMNPKA